MKRSFLLLFLWLPLILEAQENYVENIGVENGLPQSEVNDLIQDSRGFIWVGTSSGVGVFDGLDFKVYDATNGLGGDIVTCVSEGPEGNVFVGTTWGGVSVYDGIRFLPLSIKEGLNSSYVHDLFTHNEKLYILTSRGICTYANGEIQKCADFPASESKIDLAGLALDLNNELVCFASTGLYNVSEGSITLREEGNYSVYFADKATSSTFTVIDGSLSWNNDKLGGAEPSKALGTPVLEQCTDILRDRDGALWLADAELGVFKIQGDQVRHYAAEESFEGTRVHRLMQDREGIIWVGTLGKGLFKLMAKPFSKFGDGMYEPGSLFGFEQDAEGNILFQDIYEGIYRWDGTSVEPIVNQANTGAKRFFSITTDSSGTTWVGTTSGLVEYRNRIVKIHTSNDGLPGDFVRTAHAYGESLWMGTNEDGLVEYRNGEFTVHFKDELAGQYIHYIHQTANGDLWIGTGGGLFRKRGDKLDHFLNGLCNSYVGSIAEDKWGNIWVATDHCVSMFDGKEFHNYNRRDGMSSNVVYLIQNDSEGNIWIGTNNGLDKLIFGEDGEVLNVKHYSQSEGFAGIECNARASFVDDDGRMWIGSIDGAYIYNEKFDEINRKPPITFIRNIEIFFDPEITYNYYEGELNWFGLPDEFNLPHFHNHLTFDFVGLNHRAPQNVTYSYKLEGFDENWSPMRGQRNATYSNLEPGTYTFKVVACNSDGVCNEEPTVFGPINIAAEPEEPISTSSVIVNVLIGIIVLLLIVFAVYFGYFRNRELSRQRNILEQKVNVRANEISKQNEEKELLLQEIHHRVKNNLQIINSLMNLQMQSVEDEQVQEAFNEARNRIRSMALIHEKIYETRSYVAVKMKDYVRELVNNLVQTYSIKDNVRIYMNVDDDIKLKMERVVPVGLIINEAISNSLKYAFPEDQPGMITIEFKLEKEGYSMHLGDDGKGLPDGFDHETDGTMGVELIHMLTEQLNGEIRMENDNGLHYYITFS